MLVKEIKRKEGSMLIGIDATKAASKNKTGIENLVYDLILNFKKVDKDNIYFLYTNQPLPVELTNQFNMVECRVRTKRFWNKIGLPIALLKYRPNVYIQPASNIPLFAPKKTIAIVHDLAWRYYPKAYSLANLLKQKLVLRNYSKKAKKIITISQSTKEDLAKFYPKQKHKTIAIPISYNRERFKEIKKPKNVLKIDFPYILFTGRLEERKNIIRIIKAYEKLRDESDNIGHKLVLAGKPGYCYEKIYETINHSKYLKDIILPGYIADSDYPDLLAGADLFLFPTLYEGFGIPILEAFAMGVPVVTSNISSMPEVAGDSAALVNPLDIEEIYKAMYKIIIDRSLRENYREKGLKRAGEFSFEETARKYLEVLKKV